MKGKNVPLKDEHLCDSCDKYYRGGYDNKQKFIFLKEHSVQEQWEVCCGYDTSLNVLHNATVFFFSK